MCCYFLFILLLYFPSPCERYVFHFPPSSFWVIIWKKISTRMTLNWVHCILLLVSKRWEVIPCYTLEMRSIYSIIQGMPFIHTIKKASFQLDPYPLAWRQWERASMPYISSSTAPLVHQRAVPLCTPSPAKHSCHGGGAGGWHESRCLWRREGLCWDSALNRLQPSPPTPASARASDILLGSPRAAPGCQKQDFAPIKPLSLHSPAMGSFP